MLEQPSVADTVAILRGLKDKYEAHHGVMIADSALVAAAALSHRYISDRFLPDKAIDLIDEAAAKLGMDATSRPQELDEVSRRLLRVEMELISLAAEAEDDPRAQTELAGLDAEAAQLRVRQVNPNPDPDPNPNPNPNPNQADLMRRWEEEKAGQGAGEEGALLRDLVREADVAKVPRGSPNPTPDTRHATPDTHTGPAPGPGPDPEPDPGPEPEPGAGA